MYTNLCDGESWCRSNEVLGRGAALVVRFRSECLWFRISVQSGEAVNLGPQSACTKRAFSYCLLHAQFCTEHSVCVIAFTIVPTL